MKPPTKEEVAAMKLGKVVGVSRKPPEIVYPKPGTPPPDLRPMVQLPGNDRLLSDFATELARHLKTNGVYNRGDIAMIVNQKKDGLEVVSSQTLRTLVERHVICYREHISVKEKTFNFTRTMTESDASCVLKSPQFLECLSRLDRVAFARLPVRRADGKIELLQAGYDVQSATLTIPTCEYDERLTLPGAKRTIDDLVGEFSFADERSRAVAVAAIVGQFSSGLIPQDTPHPVFCYLANAEGAGKTLCAKTAISPTHGRIEPGGDLKDGPELRKLLLTAVLEARGYIFFDNCKGYLNSPALEGFISSAHWRDRVLGISKTFAGENICTVFLTGNGCKFSPDLRRRSLVVELRMNEEFAEDRKFKRALDDNELLRLRPNILAALWCLVREWDRAGRPAPSREHASFPRWAEVVGGIVEFAGYGCPLERAVIEGMVDTDSMDMRRLIDALAADEKKEEFAFSDLTDKCAELGCFDLLINDVGINGDLKPGPKSTLAGIFARYDRRWVGRENPLCLLVEGKGRTRRFKVSAVKPPEKAAYHDGE
jgi:hypothetical protein